MTHKPRYYCYSAILCHTSKTMKSAFIVLLLQICWLPSLMAQRSVLQSGPMVGFSAMREVTLWVQTTSEADVAIEYWVAGKEEKTWKTDTEHTEKKQGYCTHLLATEVEPGQLYHYRLLINQKAVELPYLLQFRTQPLWQWRTHAPDFSFAIGSCFYVNEPVYDRPGKPYGSNFQVLGHILKKEPQFMLWLGDNTYLREADFDSFTGMQKRYTHTRSVPELQPLLGAMHHYAIWDDHDFGPNNSDASFKLKNYSEQLFKQFWANPNYNPTGAGGVGGSFSWHDVDFFLLDNRYFRTADTNHSTTRQMLGNAQIEWLINALSSSQAPFKVLVAGGQMLNPTVDHENYAIFKEEREHLLALLRASKVEGIVFLSGDIHHTELSKMEGENKGDYPFYDLTVSPLTAGPTYKSVNALMENGTAVYEHNFGLLSVKGSKENRALHIQIIGADNELKWEKTITAKELQYQK